MRTCIIAILVLLSFTACQEDYLLKFSDTSNEPREQYLKSEIQFTYSLANSDTDSVYHFYSTDVEERKSGWLFRNNKLNLMREISFRDSIAGQRDQSLEVSLEVRKVEEDSALVRLEDRELYYWERTWDYLSYEDEAENFYRHYTGAALSINGKVLFSSDESGSIEITSTKKVVIDGMEKTWVEIHFEGDVFGVYDPFKEYEDYIVRDGVFRGTIQSIL